MGCIFNKNSFSISGPKPAGLNIRRDNEGVPHIQANNMNSAMWGSGYAHAVDRGTQLMMCARWEKDDVVHYYWILMNL